MATKRVTQLALPIGAALCRPDSTGPGVGGGRNPRGCSAGEGGTSPSTWRRSQAGGQSGSCIRAYAGGGQAGGRRRARSGALPARRCLPHGGGTRHEPSLRPPLPCRAVLLLDSGNWMQTELDWALQSVHFCSGSSPCATSLLVPMSWFDRAAAAHRLLVSAAPLGVVEQSSLCTQLLYRRHKG